MGRYYITVFLMMVAFLLIGQRENIVFTYKGSKGSEISLHHLRTAKDLQEIMPRLCQSISMDVKHYIQFQDRIRLVIHQPYQKDQSVPDNCQIVMEILNAEIYLNESLILNVNGTNLKCNSFSNVTFGDKLEIRFKFKYKGLPLDYAYNADEVIEANYWVEVIPDIQAQYLGGMDGFASFLNTNIFQPYNQTYTDKRILNASIKFLIDEKGKVQQVSLLRSTDDRVLDQKIIDALYRMPIWQAARDYQGNTIPQVFVFPFFEGC